MYSYRVGAHNVEMLFVCLIILRAMVAETLLAVRADVNQHSCSRLNHFSIDKTTGGGWGVRGEHRRFGISERQKSLNLGGQVASVRMHFTV